MILGLVCAFAASFCYGIASVAQAGAVRRAATPRSRDLARSLARQPFYLIGLGLDGVGFAISLVALHVLPLFVAEAVLTSSVGVTALVGTWWLHLRPSIGEYATLVALGLGLVLLALAASDRPVRPLPAMATAGLLAAALILAALTALVIARGVGGNRTAAVASGLAFAGLGITVRVMPLSGDWWRVAASADLYSLILFGLTGTVGFATSLQRGSVTSVAAVVFGIETVVPAVIGVLALGDRPSSGLMPFAAAGFALTLGATLLLSRYVEAPP